MDEFAAALVEAKTSRRVLELVCECWHFKFDHHRDGCAVCKLEVSFDNPCQQFKARHEVEFDWREYSRLIIRTKGGRC